MKLFIKLMLTIVVIAIALPFIMFGPNGGPLISLKDVKTPPVPKVSMPDLPNVDVNMDKAVGFGEKLVKPVQDSLNDALEAIGLSEKVEPITTYTWKDDKGVIHFSDKQPPEGVKYTTSTYIPQKNTKRKEQVVEPETRTEQQSDSKIGELPIVGDMTLKEVYSPENIKKLVKDAEHVKELVEERYRNMERDLQE